MFCSSTLLIKALHFNSRNCRFCHMDCTGWDKSPVQLPGATRFFSELAESQGMVSDRAIALRKRKTANPLLLCGTHYETCNPI